MNKQIQSFALLLAVTMAALAGCEKYKTQYEGPYEDGLSDNQPQAVVYEIAYVDNGVLTLTDRYFAHTKTFDNLGSSIEKIAINAAHDRIAYKKPFENITIVDSTGTILKEIPQSDDALWFDWHANNQTLYFMNEYTNSGQLFFDGPAVSAPFANMKGSAPFVAFGTEINTAVLLPDGGVVFDFYVPGFNPFHYLIGIFPQGSPYQDFEIVMPQYERMKWMRASADGETILLGSTDYDSRYFQLDITTKNMFEMYNYTEYAAISPDANFRVIAYNEALFIPENNLNKGVGTVTALDW